MKKNAQNLQKEEQNLPNTNPKAIERLKNLRQKKDSVDQIFKGIQNFNITDISKAITLIESTAYQHQERAQQLIEQCLPYANNSIRIGITGVPGVGKSTFIEVFGTLLQQQGKKVAILAVDPSSSISKGSILGDKTRMESLVQSQHVFIRPSPSGNSLGGVAQKTRESIIICEAAGFDTIIIETVGVGQSETAVHSMVDFFLLLKLAGAGDELQGIKRGIIEMADAIVINKADGNNIQRAKEAKNQFQKALHLYPIAKNEWQPKVMVCSALKNSGIDQIWQMVQEYINLTKSNHHFEINRKRQNKFWLLQTIEERLNNEFINHPEVKKELPRLLKAVQDNTSSPFAAANFLLRLVKGKE